MVSQSPQLPNSPAPKRGPSRRTPGQAAAARRSSAEDGGWRCGGRGKIQAQCMGK